MTLKPRILIALSLVLGAALAIGAYQTEEVAKTAAEAKPLKAGVPAPDAKLMMLDGKATTLKAALGDKPTVLIFYRGGWCPFCNAHLADLGRIEGEIRAKGYQILAISPDLPAELQKSMDKNHVAFTLLSDPKVEAMKRFGVAFRVDDATFAKYRDQYKVDQEKYSGQMHHILPVPSVFVIDPKGMITFAHSNPDYRVRLKGDEVLAALESR